ncbi:hypothetical protein [Campylobacter sp. RM16191]|uniref:hypothetical protein n=1 Tax=Campylobacter sp. RM16191 TaxID=1705728 RepID=UPI001475528C|nr:hypothetical protein [Campylobacter sp. RM16191]
MTRLEKLLQVQKSLNELIKAEKDYQKLSDKYSLDNCDYSRLSRSQQAKISDKLGDYAFDVKVKTDNLHADLVDADLCEMKEAYEQRELRQNAGLGHVYTFAYAPKVPQKYKQTQEVKKKVPKQEPLPLPSEQLAKNLNAIQNKYKIGV